MRFAFIEQHRDRWPITLMCKVLRVARGGYYAWLGRPAGRRRERRAELAARVRAAHADSRGIYGSPRVHRELAACGVRCCVNTVAKIMREEGLSSRMKRKFKPPATTDSRHDHKPAENLLERDFEADRPNRKWAVDITYVPTREGWLYLAVVLDLCSRRVIGYAMADHLRAELALEALRRAILLRGVSKGLVHHSDRGVQYACKAYRELLASHGIAASMSGKGDCYDNAMMESFFGSMKTEWVHHEEYATRAEAERSIFEYIEVFYNRTRRHSSLGYVSPLDYERQAA